MLLYYLIIRQGFFISANCDDNFGKLLSFAISIMLAFQVYVNISMTMGLSPVVGGAFAIVKLRRLQYADEFYLSGDIEQY